MPQLDFNTFAGIAWWVIIIFYISYIWFLIYPFARRIAVEKSVEKYRLYKLAQLASSVDEIKED